jgi:hypothetical protein
LTRSVSSEIGKPAARKNSRRFGLTKTTASSMIIVLACWPADQ